MRALVFVVLAAARVAHADPATPIAGADTSSAGFRGQKGVIGLGVVLGEPTGICGKLYISDDRAIDAAVGEAFISGGFQLTADYLLHPYILQDRDSFVMPFYVGPGIRLIDYGGSGNSSYFATGLRGVAGLAFDFKDVPIDAFVEAAAVIETGYTGGHGLGGGLNAGAGVRYYF